MQLLVYGNSQHFKMIHLTGHNYNSRDIIQNIFAPLVGVVTSPLADDICHKNNLSFGEILQPFCKLPCDAHFRDVSGTSVSIKGLRLNICDIDWRPPQTVLARKMLNEAVLESSSDAVKIFKVGSLNLELPAVEPWFEKWRETFLTVQFPSDHEFTRHFLSCLIILSSNDPNIVETASKLTHSLHLLQNVTPQKLPKWFYPNNVLNSYVVLHEVFHGDLLKAQQSYELLKATYGENKCFLIQLNSLNGSEPNNLVDHWGPYIKRLSKMEAQDSNSAPKTPQDLVSVLTIPTQPGNTSDNTSIADNDLTILHPLSPVQENATEAINSKFSVSTESIPTHTINTNVWPADMDMDAPFGSFLNSTDVENLRHFVQDYAIRALLPYVEQLVFVINEAIANKKGVSKSLLSATKRWFVTNKPGVGTSTQNAVIYTNESIELQTRKLGDLYFMFGHYNLAFQAYHQAKRDFNADAAWQYYAGALEMAAVSAFMLGTSNRKTYDYMEDAIVCYLTVCRLQQFATRATLLSIECLKTARLYSEAAKQLTRMTSEESDLRSALLLEQAAYCFLATHPPMYRKYAFHMVLAGNRFSRAGQRKHSYRCYKQAYQVFQHCGWGFAEDHIQYTMAKQAITLKKLEEASNSFAYLLRSSSTQSAIQQSNFLKEYIQTQKEFLRTRDTVGLLSIALPQIIQSSFRVLLAAVPPVNNSLYIPASNININSDFADETVWHKIEEMILLTAVNKPIVFKPSCSLYNYNQFSNSNPVAVVTEPIQISVEVVNTIKCSVTLTEIDILWKLKLESDEVLSNIRKYEGGSEAEHDMTTINAAVKATCIDKLVLDEHETKKLYFQLTPKLIGQLSIVGIVGNIAATSDPTTSLLGSLKLRDKEEIQLSKSNTELFENAISIKIVPSVPCLSVNFSNAPTNLLVGEIVSVKVSLVNTGIIPIDDIYIGFDCPRWITFQDKKAETPLSILKSLRDLTNEKLVKDKEIRRHHVFRLPKREGDFALKPQETTVIPMWIQAPYKNGDFHMRLLFYYSFQNNMNEHFKYRLVRHSWKFNIHEGLRTSVTCVLNKIRQSNLGLSVQFQNASDVQHSLVKEIYINSVGIFCPQYRIAENILHLNTRQLTAGSLGDHCLKNGTSADFQFRLEPSKLVRDKDLVEDYIKNRLFLMDIYPVKSNLKDLSVPALNEIYSFLMKNETKFLHASETNEDFNALLVNDDQHITIFINWTAAICDNSQQRLANGQHFVKLRYFYETVTCPKTTAPESERNQLNPVGIYELVKNDEISNEYCSRPNGLFDNDDNANWEENNEFFGTRCILEDEYFRCC